MKKEKKQLAIYQAENGAIELREDFDNDTIWATQKQMAEVFGVDVRTINEHIQNIFKTEELEENSVIRKFRITASDGKKYNTKHYNLDTIISVGYRVNSKTATNFRRWATKTLKQHITEGYTINPERVSKNYDNFLDAVDKVQKLLPKDNTLQADDILELIKTFADTWFSLESYDEDKLPQKGITKKIVEVQADDLYRAVEKFKGELVKKKQATDIFAQEKNKKSLEGILGNVLQSVFGDDVYPSVEGKAAHLLYFIVKNHPFTDGNKRTGAFAFIWFLQKTEVSFRDKITPEALTTITLLVAESNPKDKDRIIGLVLLLLQGDK